MPRLARNVRVGGVWYGPAHGNADKVPDELAAKITNPKAWEDAPVESVDGSSEDGPGAQGAMPQPNRNDAKAVWVDYAVTQGADRDEAEGMSKADLVAAFGE